VGVYVESSWVKNKRGENTPEGGGERRGVKVDKRKKMGEKGAPRRVDLTKRKTSRRLLDKKKGGVGEPGAGGKKKREQKLQARGKAERNKTEHRSV